jgi:hypothetical protein
MKLSEIKTHLVNLNTLNFVLPDGSYVPEHFHVTEVGSITKNFIDCGGTIRNENVISFQLWNANDTDHRLKPEKLLNIISLSENKLGIKDDEVEVEYQSDTIGKYGLEFDGTNFILTQKNTACLASDQCGIPAQKPRIKLTDLNKSETNSCTPGGGCC